jgi:hypothetical protein
VRSPGLRARARPSTGVLKDAHASASGYWAEPALQGGTPSASWRTGHLVRPIMPSRRRVALRCAAVGCVRGSFRAPRCRARARDARPAQRLQYSLQGLVIDLLAGDRGHRVALVVVDGDRHSLQAPSPERVQLPAHTNSVRPHHGSPVSMSRHTRPPVSRMGRGRR